MRSDPWALPVFCVLLTACFLAGCYGGHESSGTGDLVTVDRRSGTPVILIGLDTVRNDHLGVAGNGSVRTPHLDALAADGVYFATCQSTSPWTGPSFASIFTGLLPYRHGFLGGYYGRLHDRFKTLAEHFGEAGYATGAYVTIGWLIDTYGMAQGLQEGERFVDHGRGAEASLVTAGGLEFVRRHRQEPFYLFMHYFDAHAPYMPPAPFGGMYYDGVRDAPGTPLVEFLESDENQVLNDGNKEQMYAWLEGVTDWDYPARQYAAGVSFVDAQLGEFVAGLKKQGVYDESIIIVVSDHGEHLGEHGYWYTHAMPYEEAIRVPLVIKWPDSHHAGTVVRQRVSTADILPTLLLALGRDPGRDLDGRDLAPLVADPVARTPSILVAEQGGRPDLFQKTLVRGTWKLHAHWTRDDVTTELYDLEADPGETVDVADTHPGVAGDLLAELRRICDGDDPLTSAAPMVPKDLTDENVQRLRSLGYVQ